MKKDFLKYIQLPAATTFCGLLLHLMDWLTVFRVTQKGGVWTPDMDFRMITNRLSASLVMIAAMGIFVIRKRTSFKQCSTGCGILVLWGLAFFGLSSLIPNAELLLNILGLPVYLFSFITEFLVLFGSTATGFDLAAPAVVAPVFFLLFLIGRKNPDETGDAEMNMGRTLRDM